MAHEHASAATLVKPGRAFAIGIALNLAFVGIEAGFGWVSGSLALMADAAHNLSDVGGLLLAWAAMTVARLKPNERHTYGWRRATILASLANATLLLVAMGALAWEAIGRIGSTLPVEGVTVTVVAAIGVLVNFATAWLFMGGRQDLNIRGAFLHMAADGLVSAGVVVSGLLTIWMGWAWLDPLASLGVAAVVVVGTWSLFRQSLHLVFDGVPEGLDVGEVRRSLEGIDGVAGVHHLHVWALDTSETALTVHLVVEADGRDLDGLLAEVNQRLANAHEIRHATIQFESKAYAERCTAAGR